ncbi:MAG: hypothetical protein AAFQ85_01355 [Pseudomonadota bacterium]
MAYSPPFREIPPDTPHLDLARLPAFAARLLEYADEQGGLALTPGGALKRVHVTWAAEAFAWPSYTLDELYCVNKVLNEEDVFPLWVLHQLLIHTKHARHDKKAFRPTKAGHTLIGAPHRAFNQIVPCFLFEVDHGAMGRGRSGIPGGIRHYLDVLNLEANEWTGLEALTNTILGPSPEPWDPRPPSLYVEALRPLIWSGLLLEKSNGSRDNSIMKSPLWHAAIILPSDRQAGRES